MTGCRPLSEQEINQFKASLERVRDRALFVLGVRSGFRISELLSLKVSDVIQHGKPAKHVKVARRNMKGSKASRTVLMHPEAAQAVLDLVKAESLEQHHYLFRSRKGANAPLGYVQAWRILKAAAAESELDGQIATHSMRKTFAKNVFEAAKRDILKTQKLLGHVDLNSTTRYLAVDDADLDAIVMNQVISHPQR